MKEADKIEWVRRIGRQVEDDVHNNYPLDYPLQAAFDQAAALGFEDGQEFERERLQLKLKTLAEEQVVGARTLPIEKWDQGFDAALEAVAEAFGLEL